MTRCILSFLFAAALPSSALEPGFTALFNGTDLTGWSKAGNQAAQYTVQDNCIIGSGTNLSSNAFLRTTGIYRDFDFRFEMKFDDLTGNSGVMFRGFQINGNGNVTGYQCEHDNGKARAWTAGIYDENRRGWLAPAGGTSGEAGRDFTAQGLKLFRWNDWNQIRIVCQGTHLRIWLNGKLRTDYTDTSTTQFTPEGFFALQVHGGTSCHVRWRNLRYKPL